MRWRRALACLLIGTAAAPRALAAPGDAPPPPGDARLEPAPPSDARDEAVARFERGLSLFDAGDFSAALAEFLEARRLYPLRNATFNAAGCLEKLRRYDEAMDLLEGLLRDSGAAMPADARDRAQRKLIELRGLVGTVEIVGAEPDAAVVIDGRDRGVYPPLAPLRVAAGSHMVRVVKEGFEPFEQRVEVPGGRTVNVAAPLRALARSGRLNVVEQGGKRLDVLVDGALVGATPWSGRLPVGEHVVLLRGEGQLGTPPVSIAVDLDQTTRLALTAEALSARLRIEPVPLNAAVAIDGVAIGRGVWVGRLRAGEHRVEVSAPGFLPSVESITIPPGEQRTRVVRLTRDPRSPFAERPARWIAELGVAGLIAPRFGGDVGAGLGLGGYAVLRVGYELPFRLALGLSLGGLHATRTTPRRAASVSPVNLRPDAQASILEVQVEDTMQLQGLFTGAWVGLSLGERVVGQLRLGGGALLGAASDLRRGAPGGSGAAFLGASREVRAVRALVIAPEARLGLTLTRHLTLSIGAELLALLHPSPARWDEERAHLVSIRDEAGRAAYGLFASERSGGPAELIFAPGLDARYDF